MKRSLFNCKHILIVVMMVTGLAGPVWSAEYSRIKSRWRADQFINVEHGGVEIGAVEPTWLSAQWSLEPVAGTSFIRIRNHWRPTQFLHMERGALESGVVQDSWLSAQWHKESVPGTSFVRLKNRWTNQYIHVEHGRLEGGPIQNTWLSAQWAIEPVAPVSKPPIPPATFSGPTDRTPPEIRGVVVDEPFGLVHPGVSIAPEPKLTIEEKYAALGGTGSVLGSPSSPERTSPDGEGKYRLYAQGIILWHPLTGAHELHGPVFHKFLSLSPEGPSHSRFLSRSMNELGYPTTDEITEGTVRFNGFQKGGIYFVPPAYNDLDRASGASIVKDGPIRRKWFDLRSAGTDIGFPKEDEVVRDGVHVQVFERGLIAQAPGGEPAAVHDDFYDKWRDVDGREILGYPMADQVRTPDRRGEGQFFQKGAIYKNPTGGVYELHGLIYQKWRSLGWETSSLRYPVSDEEEMWFGLSRGRRQRFQGGLLYWTGGREPWIDTYDISAIQYNVQFLLPDRTLAEAFDHWPSVPERARAIGEALACYDIIALEETLNDDRRRDLLGELERAGSRCGKPSRLPGGKIFTWIDGPDVAGGTNSIPNPSEIDDVFTECRSTPIGDDEVTLVSRFPIVSAEAYTYVNGGGIDAFAAKGVLHARLARGPANDFMDVFVTHLQNGGPCMAGQVRELAAFVRHKADPTKPVLIMGDFNINAGTPEYRNLMDTLGRALPSLRDRWVELHRGELGATTLRRTGERGPVILENRRIDFMLYSGPDVSEPRTMEVNEFRDSRWGTLSDHAAVEATLRWPARDLETLPDVRDNREVQVTVTRLIATSEDECNLTMDFYAEMGSFRAGARTDLTRYPREDYVEGNDIGPNWAYGIGASPGTREVRFDIRIRDDDDRPFCGANDDKVAVNPTPAPGNNGDTDLRVAVDLVTGEVRTLRYDGTVNGVVGAVGFPITLQGVNRDESNNEEAQITFQVNVRRTVRDGAGR